MSTKKTPDKKSPSGTDLPCPVTDEILQEEGPESAIELIDQNGTIQRYAVEPEVAEGVSMMVDDYKVLQEFAAQSIEYIESIGGSQEDFKAFVEFHGEHGEVMGNA